MLSLDSPKKNALVRWMPKQIMHALVSLLFNLLWSPIGYFSMSVIGEDLDYARACVCGVVGGCCICKLHPSQARSQLSVIQNAQVMMQVK
jgi:hypothetical protein